MGLKRDDKVYDDEHFAIYQVPHDMFIIYCKDLDEVLDFTLEANTNTINVNGLEVDNIEDVHIKLNGSRIMSFDGAYI